MMAFVGSAQSLEKTTKTAREGPKKDSGKLPVCFRAC